MKALTLEQTLKNYSEDYYKYLNNSLDTKNYSHIDRLKNLGFKSSLGVTMFSKTVETINTLVEVSNIISFIVEVKKCFGQNTIVVKRSDFEKIIKKYNLQCGEFNDYLGIIPDKNLDEIEKVKSIIDKFYNYRDNITFINRYKELKDLFLVFRRDRDGEYFHNYRYLRKIKTINSNIKFYRNFKTLSRLSRIPFVYNDPYDNIEKAIDIQFNKNGFSDSLNIGVRDYYSIKNLFICAPRNEMLNRPKFSISFKKKEKDPFICSLCKYGVIIYSSWGKEAEDETLRKYINLLK